jgi:hypothetical protein
LETLHVYILPNGYLQRKASIKKIGALVTWVLTAFRVVHGIIMPILSRGLEEAGPEAGVELNFDQAGWQSLWMRYREDKAWKDRADCERIGASPLNPLEGGFACPGRSRNMQTPLSSGRQFLAGELNHFALRGP